MKKSRFTDSQILEALKRAEACGAGAMPGTGHQFGNVLQMALEVRRDGRVDDVAHEGLEAENARLRKMYIEEKLKAEIASEALQKF